MNQNHDLIKFTTMLINLGELYGRNISEILTDLYWQSLKCFEFQDVKRALEAHIHNPDSGQYFPKPADLVRFIDGSGETKALQAWAKVEKTISQVGIYQNVVFDDPLIHAVLEDMGGWVKLCTTLSKELPFRAIEFQKRYMIFVIKPPGRYPKYCYGLIESVNAHHGYSIKSQLFVGDPKKAKQVILAGSDTALLINSEDIIKNIQFKKL
jgi:hypothetical protein